MKTDLFLFSQIYTDFFLRLASVICANLRNLWTTLFFLRSTLTLRLGWSPASGGNRCENS